MLLYLLRLEAFKEESMHMVLLRSNKNVKITDSQRNCLSQDYKHSMKRDIFVYHVKARDIQNTIYVPVLTRSKTKNIQIR